MRVRLQEIEPGLARDVVAPDLEGEAKGRVIVPGVQRGGQPRLPEVPQAARRFAALLRPGQGWQQELEARMAMTATNSSSSNKVNPRRGGANPPGPLRGRQLKSRIPLDSPTGSRWGG